MATLTDAAGSGRRGVDSTSPTDLAVWAQVIISFCCLAAVVLLLVLLLYRPLRPGRRRNSSSSRRRGSFSQPLPLMQPGRRHLASTGVAAARSNDPSQAAAIELVKSVESEDCQRVWELLADNRLSPNQTDPRPRKMRSPVLVTAIGEGRCEAAKLLMSQPGINCNLARSDETTPLIMAASRGHDELVPLLLARPEVDVNARNSNRSTSLIVSSRAGNAHTVKLLVDAGAECGLAQYTGLTALHFSSREGHLEIVQCLLEAARSPSELTGAQDRHRFTPLMYCCQRDCHEVARLLLSFSDGRSLRTDKGTALHVAAFHNSNKSLALLMESGKLDPSIQDTTGRTALDGARRRGNRECEALLLPIEDRSVQRGNASSTLDIRSTCVPSPRSTASSEDSARFSRRLHQRMLDCGFVQARAIFQAGMSELLAELGNTGEMRQRFDRRRPSGSFADGWGGNLSHVNGSLGRDSDVDISVEKNATLHVEGACRCPGAVETHPLVDGFLQLNQVSGDRPSKTDLAVGVRPSMDFCAFIPCCSCPQEVTQSLLRLPERFRLGLPVNPPVEFVRSVRPGSGSPSEMRISCTSLEKGILRQLSTCQGQVFVLVKYIFKRVVTAAGLKSYHSKTLMFFLIRELANEEDWQTDRLERLVDHALWRFEGFILECEGLDKVCMPHFFLDNTWVYFKSGSQADRWQLIDCLEAIRKNLRRVLEKFAANLRPLSGGHINSPFVFHPFTTIEMVTPFERPPVPESGRLAHYCQVYPMVFKILADICKSPPSAGQLLGAGDRESPNEFRGRLARDIDSLPDYAATTRAALRVLLHLRLGDEDKAKQLLEEAATLKAARCVRFEACQSVEEASQFIQRQLESTNSAWKFCFYFNSQLSLDFVQALPDCGFYQLPGYLLLDFAYFVNFDAVLKALCLSLIPDRPACSQLLADWFAELTSAEDGDDIHELLLFARFAATKKQLVHCRDRMLELSIQLDEEADMVDFVEQRIAEFDRCV